MKNIKINDKVWVAPGNNLKGPDSYMATFCKRENGFIWVRNKDGRYAVAEEGNVFKLITCPIDESSNLHTDWIEKELLVDTAPSYNDSVLGWLLDDECYYPVICTIQYGFDKIVFTFGIQSGLKERAAHRIVLDFLDKAFNHCPKNNIVYKANHYQNGLVVSFYWIDRD